MQFPNAGLQDAYCLYKHGEKHSILPLLEKLVEIYVYIKPYYIIDSMYNINYICTFLNILTYYFCAVIMNFYY